MLIQAAPILIAAAWYFLPPVILCRMQKEITIQAEQHNHGSWIKINVPYHTAALCSAIFENEGGELLKKVALNEGNNAIDISSIQGGSITVKVDTPFETILKQIKINHS